MGSPSYHSRANWMLSRDDLMLVPVSSMRSTLASIALWTTSLQCLISARCVRFMPMSTRGYGAGDKVDALSSPFIRTSKDPDECLTKVDLGEFVEKNEASRTYCTTIGPCIVLLERRQYSLRPMLLSITRSANGLD